MSKIDRIKRKAKRDAERRIKIKLTGSGYYRVGWRKPYWWNPFVINDQYELFHSLEEAREYKQTWVDNYIQNVVSRTVIKVFK